MRGDVFGDLAALLRRELQVIREPLQHARVGPGEFHEPCTTHWAHVTHALAAIPNDPISTDFPHFLARGLCIGRVGRRRRGHGLGQQR
jgi:hypothetical protein